MPRYSADRAARIAWTMAAVHRIIEIHIAAPAKPPVGQPCNGCGVCCASEPCPLGVLVSRRRHGACAALLWKDDDAGGGVYRCGLIEQPATHLPAALRRAAPLLARVARRYISAGSGCDAGVSVAGDASVLSNE